jgi:hypothetical protein
VRSRPWHDDRIRQRINKSDLTVNNQNRNLYLHGIERYTVVVASPRCTNKVQSYVVSKSRSMSVATPPKLEFVHATEVCYVARYESYDNTS